VDDPSFPSDARMTFRRLVVLHSSFTINWNSDHPFNTAAYSHKYSSSTSRTFPVAGTIIALFVMKIAKLLFDPWRRSDFPQWNTRRENESNWFNGMSRRTYKECKTKFNYLHDSIAAILISCLRPHKAVYLAIYKSLIGNFKCFKIWQL
jgi:hypothetical protein